MNLIELLEEVKKVVDEGRAVDVVHMEFSKEIDKSPIVVDSEAYQVQDPQ